VSIVAAVRRVSELIGQATITGSGTRLQSIDAGHGQPLDMASQPEGPTRPYDLQVTATEDGGEAGCISTRVRVSALLTVRYRLAGSRLERGAQQAADYTAIRDVTCYAPATWQQSSTGLVGMQLGPYAIAPLINAGQLSGTHELMTATFVLEVDP
jgi:hypothetical protein